MVRATTVLALARRLRQQSRRAEQDVAFDLKAASNYLEAFAATLRRERTSRGVRNTTDAGAR
jgi:hypothetical protein